MSNRHAIDNARHNGCLWSAVFLGANHVFAPRLWEEHSRIVLQHFTCLGRRGCRLSSVGAPSLHVSVYLMAGSESDGLTMMTSSGLPRPGLAEGRTEEVEGRAQLCPSPQGSR